MKKEDFLILVEKYENSTANAEERKIVEDFFSKMQDSSVDIVNPDEKGKYLFQQIKNNISVPVQRKRRLKPLKIAAVLFLIAGMAFTINVMTSSVKQITETTAKGQQREIILEDGSHVILNSNSSITFSESFDSKREITLKGEAYFKVHRDTTKPFIVTTHDLNVRVLGTSFNINSYDHNDTKVSVISGKVQVTSPSGEQKVLIKDQQVSLPKNQLFSFSEDDSTEGIAWTQNTIFLKKNTLAETAKIIENWYDVQVDFENDSLKNLTISGKFKDEKFENVLSSIAALKELEIKYITKNHVLIREKRQLH